MNYVDHVTDENNVVHTLVDPGGRDMQKVAGAYNLLPNNAESGTYGGLTVIVNADKTISTTPGSNRQGFELVIFNDVNNPIELESDCLFMLCVDIPSAISSYAIANDGTAYYLSETRGNKQIIPKNTKIVSVKIYFSNQFNVTLTFKPIITPDLTATYDDYVPYAMSNRDITKNLKYHTGDVMSIGGENFGFYPGAITARDDQFQVYISTPKELGSDITGFTVSNVTIGAVLSVNGHISSLTFRSAEGAVLCDTSIRFSINCTGTPFSGVTSWTPIIAGIKATITFTSS